MCSYKEHNPVVLSSRCLATIPFQLLSFLCLVLVATHSFKQTISPVILVPQFAWSSTGSDFYSCPFFLFLWQQFQDLTAQVLHNNSCTQWLGHFNNLMNDIHFIPEVDLIEVNGSVVLKHLRKNKYIMSIWPIWEIPCLFSCLKSFQSPQSDTCVGIFLVFQFDLFWFLY